MSRIRLTFALNSIAILALFSSCSRQRDPVAHPENWATLNNGNGSLLVTSPHEDVQVFVDGIFRGGCPVHLFLSEGVYTIEARKKGVEDYCREVQIYVNSKVTIGVKWMPIGSLSTHRMSSDVAPETALEGLIE